MKSLVFALALAASTAAAQTPAQMPAAPADAPAVSATPPYAGSVREGQTELQRLSKSEKHDDALALARSLAAMDLAKIAEPRAAELFYAIGVASGRAERLDDARDAFAKACALAGPGGLRLDALYDTGAFELGGAERLRDLVPEIRQKKGLPPLANTPGPGAAPPAAPPMAGQANDAPQGPDPLDVAEAAYQAARTSLVARLRADVKDGDTRANLELIQRRLRELEEIKAQREKQQQEEQQQDQKQQDPKDKQDSKDGEKGSQGDPKDSQDDPSKEQEQKDQESQPPEPQPPDEKKDDKKDEKAQQGEKKDDEKKDGEQQAAPADGKESEKLLSHEEVQRLFDQLAKIEQQARAVKAMLQERRRKPVEKDW